MANNKMNLAKEILYSQEARDKMIEGVNTVANTVKETLGPNGKFVVIEKGYALPHVTKDGVSVAKEIFLEDKFANLGAQLIKQASSKSADVAGDGTTTATVLAQAIVKEGNKAISSGLNTVKLIEGIKHESTNVINKLKDMSKKISSLQELESVATISANNDEKIGRLVASAIEQVGDFGTVTLADSNNSDTFLEKAEGMSFDKGWVSPYFMNDSRKLEASYENCYVLLINKKLTNFSNDLIPIISQCIENKKLPLAIVAEDFLGDTIPSLLKNYLPEANRGSIPLVAIKSPGYGARRAELIEDLASVCGATVISDDKGTTLENADISYLGKVDKIKVGQFETVLVGGECNRQQLQDRIDLLKAQAESMPTEYDKNTYLERVSRLTGGIAVIKVGGSTEAEAKELKDRIEDALAATKAAKQEGIIVGGGSALYKCSKTHSTALEDSCKHKGQQILLKAIQEPIKQILVNAGVDNVEEILINITSDNNVGYDAKQMKFTDMLEAGIVDPTMVVRVALENAVSCACMILMTSATIVSKYHSENINVI